MMYSVRVIPNMNFCYRNVPPENSFLGPVRGLIQGDKKSMGKSWEKCCHGFIGRGGLGIGG
jgi:hypothetical protein